MGLKLRSLLGIRRSREERSSGGMVLTVTEDTPADMLAGSMELLVQLPRDHNVHTQRVTVPRSTPMMDLLVQIATAHKLSASSYTLQAIGERGLVLPHQPNTPIGALDALQVKLLPKQGTFVPRKAKQANQPFETTFRLQVLLPRNQLYVSRVSPKMNLGKILEEVCREKNLDKNKYELRHPANLEETLDLSLSLQDYHLQEVTLYAKQGRNLGAALSSQDIMALQRQEERRRQQAKQSVFGFMFRKSKESSLSIDSLGGRSVSPARSDETGRSVSPLAPPSRPQRKRRPAPKPPVRTSVSNENYEDDEEDNDSKEKLVISHSRNSSDSSGYHEASVLSDNPDSSARMPETLPRRSKPPCKVETSRKLAQTSQASKSLGNLAMASGGLSHGISSTSISSTGIRKKRAAPPPPIARPLSSAISTQALERIVDSEESLTSDIDLSKSPSDIAASSKANSDIGVSSKANSDIGVHSMGSKPSSEIGYKIDAEFRAALEDHEEKNVETEKLSAPIPPSASLKPSLDARAYSVKPESTILSSLEKAKIVETPKIVKRDTEALAPTPKPRNTVRACETPIPVSRKREILDETYAAPTMTDFAESSIANNEAVNSDLVEEQKNIEKDSDSFRDAELRERITESQNHSSDRVEHGKPSKSIPSTDGKILQKCGLNHVKSMDDIHSLSMEFSEEIIDEETDSLSGDLACAVISTIPKCAHIKPNIEEFMDVKKKEKSSEAIKSDLGKTTTRPNNEPETFKTIEKRSKIFRSQSALNDFEVTPIGKQIRHKTSHTEDFNCALNPNFPQSVVNLVGNEGDGEKLGMKDACQSNEDSTENRNAGEDFPPFVANATNLRCQELSKVAESEDSWEPQLIEQPASGDGPTETDILLQKVSDTLSNSLPASKPPLPQEVVAIMSSEKLANVRSTEKDESDGGRESVETPVRENELETTKEVEKKIHDSTLSTKNTVAQSPDATLNFQQDTSDYVSATGDDLSITDWEYQLPAPPSAFRDNVSPDFDGYDTVTLRSVEAFKEPLSETPETKNIPNLDSPLPESPIFPPKAIVEIAEPLVIPEIQVERSEPSEKSSNCENPKLDRQVSSESRKVDVSSVLKKEIISELSSMIENGALSQSSGKISEPDSRRTTADLSAPRIAPVDNTLSNFTITTYSRKKSLNIFEGEEGKEEKRNVSKFTNSSNKVQGRDALAMSKTSIENGRGNIGAKNTWNRIEDDSSRVKTLPEERERKAASVTRPEVEEIESEPKIRFTQNDSLLRRASLNKAQEKSTSVHRSKSYITLANNSKYRENVDDERLDENTAMENGNSPMVKSTSVTNLNQDFPRNNEKFSQWRENILKRQEEPSKEKQLQSLQVLKNILPRLKNNQQTEKNVTDSPNGSELSDDTSSKTLPGAESIESNSSVPEKRNESEAVEAQKNAEDATTKRYKYTGPPAISLGSWSERPRGDVQLKMDTDYKFATKNNTSGAKTCVKLNGASIEKSDNKQIKQTTLPRNFSKRVTSNGTGNQRENTFERRDSEDQLAKKLIAHTTAAGFKKPVSNGIVTSDLKTISRSNSAKPVVTSVALRKISIEKSDEKTDNEKIEDDVKIDTKPVNFRELSKTFGQEVCLRTKPKRVLQNRHSDYYGTRTDFPQNGQTNFWETANPPKRPDSSGNYVSNGFQSNGHGTVKRFTSVVGIPSQSNHNSSESNETLPRNYTTSTKLNGLVPVVKGFKITASQNETKIADSQSHNAISNAESSKKSAIVPPPPTMPIITGVTLKNSTARPKSMPICNVDPRDQLLESIRNFGGRDRLKSLRS